METIEYCSDCYEKLQELGIVAKHIMESLIEMHVKEEGPLYVRPCFNPAILKYLEEKNYLVSTEIYHPLMDKVLLAIIPQGCSCKSTKRGKHCTVCFNRKKHK